MKTIPDHAGTYFGGLNGDYTYQYEKDYISNHPKQFITFTMPVNSTAYISNRLFPFFEGLIPEGWLLDIASKSWKINQNEHFGKALGLNERQVTGAFNRMISNKPTALQWIDRSFLSKEHKKII